VAAVAKMQTKMNLSSVLGGVSPLELLHSLTVAIWAGPFNVVIPTGTSAQSLIVYGQQGVSQLRALLLTSDQQITVFYNSSVAGILMFSGGYHALCDTTLTAVTLTNVSGVAANVTYFAAGS